MELSQEALNDMSVSFGKELQAAIEKVGLAGFQVETVTLTKKDNATVMGLIPECRMECKVGGFPPKVSCKLVCD